MIIFYRVQLSLQLDAGTGSAISPDSLDLTLTDENNTPADVLTAPVLSVEHDAASTSTSTQV